MTGNRYRVDFANITTPNLDDYATAADISSNAYRAREKSKPQKLVNSACKAEAEVISAVIAAHNLEEMIVLELRLQTNDLEKYAHSAAEVKGVEQGLADLQSGIHMYSILKTAPEQYRELAKGFTDRNRDKRLDVPKDGMRYALSSQMTRLQNRHSLQLSEEEKALLVVRRQLVDALCEGYSAMQREAVHDES